MVVNDKPREIAARRQDQIAFERSELHPLDFNVFSQRCVAGDSLGPGAHLLRRGVCRSGILGSHFEDAVELLFGHRRSPVRASGEPLDVVGGLVCRDSYIF
jgi:hypothetical protein